MDKLSSADLKLACSVLEERYKACVKKSIISDVLQTADFSAPTRKCGHMFTDITEHCGELIRSGALRQVAGSAGKRDKQQAQEAQPVAAPPGKA